MNAIYKKLRKTFLFWMILICSGLLISGLYGCGDASNPDETQETGQVVISLTDDAGDFINYKVKVISLTLIKANGAIVETLPLETEVDFAQYTDMTEFLTAATVPSGVYTKACLKLDYRNADIIVENEAGEAVSVDAIEDEDGNSFETIEVSVRLSDHNRLVIAPGVPAHLSFDFDLNASNEVVFDDESITLTVHPVLLAQVDVETSRIHRVRGPLKSVSVDNNSFKVIIRPFFHVLSHGNERFGILKVISRDTTVYEINGEQFEGQDGLRELDQQTPLTAIIAIGELLFNPPRFEAREVYAGSSVPGGENDVITGNVIARSGNNLTVRGATLFRSNGSVIFNSTQIILLGENTTVSRQLSAITGSTDDISVGQKIMAFGVLNAEENQIDATSGHVRLLLTTLKGIVVDNTTDSRLVVVDLNSIDGRRTGLFDFSGTGSDLVNDADPENYEINTGELAPDNFGAGTPVKIRGFVNKFGIAPPDFTAQTLVGVANIQAILKAGWFPAEPDAFETLSSDNIIFDPDKYGYPRHVFQAGVITDLESFENGAQLIPPASGLGIFAIKQNRMVQVHTSFENFSDDLAERLTENAAVKHLTAVGAFDSNSAVLTSRRISIRLF